MSPQRCAECGAPVPDGGTCRDNLDALLYIEAAIEGGPGELAHFYAVASYGVQHPESMGFTVETVQGLRARLAQALSGSADIADIRRQVRFAAGQSGRVTRRGDERVPAWPVVQWSMTACDVAVAGPHGYAENVETWARSVVASTDGMQP